MLGQLDPGGPSQLDKGLAGCGLRSDRSSYFVSPCVAISSSLDMSPVAWSYGVHGLRFCLMFRPSSSWFHLSFLERSATRELARPVTGLGCGWAAIGL